MSAPSPVRGALFDVDGTLLDTTYLHVAAWWQAFRDAGHDVEMAAVHRAIGMGGDMLIEHLIGQADERVKTGWSRHYAPNLQRLRPFPKARELLRATAGLGLTVVLATSAPKEQAQVQREVLDVDDVLAAVTSAGDAEDAKPAPDILQVAMDTAGLRAADCLLVGDAVWDVQAAQAAGLPCVGVLTGGVSAAELREAGAVAVYDDPAALLADLDDSPIGALASR